MRRDRNVPLIVCFALVCCISGCYNQGTLSLVSYSKEAGVGYSVCVDGDYAYVTNNDGAVIFDVHQPRHPRQIGRIPTGVTFGICVKNGLAYISGERGLVIADVSDPANPRKLKEHMIREETHGVQVEGSYVYIATNAGLEILDAGDPGRITPVAHFGDSRAWGVVVCDGIAYLASDINGVEVIDVTNPGSPQKITTLADTKGAWDVHVYDEYLYVGCHRAGIAIFNISDEESHEPAGSFRDDDGGEALGVWGDGEHLYVADNFGIEALDVSDPANPYEIGEYSRVRGSHDICVDGEFIYVADASRGLIVLEFQGSQGR
jgi:hypothetical protein